MVVTRETLIGDILDFDTGTAKFFFEMGMHCLGCPHSRGESIEDACAVHGTDVEELIKNIRTYEKNRGDAYITLYQDEDELYDELFDGKR